MSGGDPHCSEIANRNPTYDDRDTERWAAEADKPSHRTPFERDRARVVHSSALRRLASKTQVHTPLSDDFIRNRLTHTLEVAQIGRELGRALGCDPDIVETACLAHDLGHPPFGHNGETALDEVASGIGGFEGNAQTLRILTRLEAKSQRADGRSAGLNLTRASLDAATKYPWPRAVSGSRHRKYGAYADDLDVFTWVRAGAADGVRCVEAQVMDWADDVAYSVHDLEDGIQAGAVDLATLRDPAERDAIAVEAQRAYAVGLDREQLSTVLAALAEQPWWPHSYDGSRRSLAGLKELTSRLVGRFSAAAEADTRLRHGTGRLTRYGADLVVGTGTRAEVAMLKAVAARYVMHTDDRQPLLAEQRAVIAALAEFLLDRAPGSLPPVLREDWRSASGDEARLRVVVDAVASLTDASAMALHAGLRTR